MDLYAHYKEKGNIITVVGDLHLNTSTPRSRIDDYATTSIVKLDTLYNTCLVRGYKIVFFEGDIFHKNNQSLSYIWSVIEAFKKFQDAGIHCYTIIGNHDISYEKLENIEKSPLGILMQTGYLKPFRLVEVETEEGYIVSVYGYHYPDGIQPVMSLESNGKINVCVAHRFYNYSFSSSTLTEDLVESLGYNIYALGHDHMPYDTEKVGKAFIVRTGSFLRGTSHSYNLERDVYIDTFKFNGSVDSPKMSLIRDKIAVRPAEEIFSTVVFNPGTAKDILDDLSKSVDELLNKFDETEGGELSIYSVIDQVKIEPRVKTRIESYLEQNGIFRKATKVEVEGGMEIGT